MIDRKTSARRGTRQLEHGVRRSRGAGHGMTMPEERSIHEARTSFRSSGDRFTAAFVLVTSLFFMWALAHNLNDILIKQFESALSLSRSEASFIQVSFYFAYF